ncbi:nectin cell adhesion molecule 1b isoform X2 [Entelurus aequoreus]|uniref:nectin cell adhesion molecule 1b isoform X2 n=1 Tax=Entelurus aequoreus TaxID=161455 RepID=UPI002B1E0A7F|nr:nectin cell adhesion molecule 1b isoform X2 [Entelurus aequoreus]
MALVLAGIYVLFSALRFQDVSAQMVQMDSGKSGFVGSQVELRCIFINSNPPVKISQVTWQKLLNGSKQNVAIANPALGVSVLPPFKERVSFKQAAVRHRTPSLEDTTIFFNNLQLYDEAAYICEYTTFPAGNRENMVNLTVFARPMTRMTLTTPTIVARPQRRKMTVATCVSANGKPPSVIKWDTRLKGEATFQETRNQNGTVTVRSNYVLLPGRETHKQKLTCIVTYRNERFSDSVVLNVQHEPQVKIEGFDSNWYLNRQNVQLTCQADANPPVTVYQWKLLNGSLPSNVEIRNNSLFFKGPVTYDLAGTYVCHATNGIGTRTSMVDVNITESPSKPAGGDDAAQEQDYTGGAIVVVVGGDDAAQEQDYTDVAIGVAVGGVALLGVAAMVLWVLVRRRQRTFKGDYSTKMQVLGNGKAPPPGGLHYPEDEEDEEDKKPSQTAGDEGEGEELKRPYFTVDEGGDYDQRTLAFQYDPRQEVSDDMISQTDGSVISKKEWYV